MMNLGGTPRPVKPNWPFWTVAAVFVLPVLYAVSFGPACWISSRTLDRVDRIGARTINLVYQPILSLAWDGPSIVRDPILWYMRLASSDRWEIGHVSGRVQWGPLPL